MKMKIKSGLTMMGIAVALLATTAARADVSYGSFLFNGQDENGSPIADGTYVMYLDLDGDGFNGNSYTAQAPTDGSVDNGSSWLWDPQDFILDIGSLTNGEAFPFRNLTTPNIPAGYTPNQDPYYIAWFKTPYTSQLGPGAGVRYGMELLGTAGADPGTYTTFATGGAALLNTVGTTVVPEPISMVLAMMGGGAFFARRRFAKKA